MYFSQFMTGPTSRFDITATYSRETLKLACLDDTNGTLNHFVRSNRNAVIAACCLPYYFTFRSRLRHANRWHSNCKHLHFAICQKQLPHISTWVSLRESFRYTTALLSVFNTHLVMVENIQSMEKVFSPTKSGQPFRDLWLNERSILNKNFEME